MASFEIAARFDAPADKVWDFVSWEGFPRLTAGGFFVRAEYPDGTAPRPGALRRVHPPEGAPPILERLVEYRAADRFYRYALVDTGAFPLTDYEGVVAVTPAGAGCCLKFGHTATLVDIAPEAWYPAWAAIERQIFDFIRQSL